MKMLLRLGTAVVLLIMLPMEVLGKCPETVVFAGATDGFNNGQNTSIEVSVPPAAQAITGLLEIVGLSSNGAVTVPGGSINPYNFTPLVAPVAAPDGTTLSAWYRFSSAQTTSPRRSFSVAITVSQAGESPSIKTRIQHIQSMR